MMAAYLFLRYTISTNGTPEYYSEGQLSKTNTQTSELSISADGYTGYEFNPEDGIYALDGDHVYLTVYYDDPPGTTRLYTNFSANLECVDLYADGNRAILDEYRAADSVYHPATNEQVPGTFLGYIVGDEAEYPADGISGGYWYIRQGALTYPFDMWVNVNGTLRKVIGGKININDTYYSLVGATDS